VLSIILFLALITAIFRLNLLLLADSILGDRKLMYLLKSSIESNRVLLSILLKGEES
jgi:hypothetical protein